MNNEQAAAAEMYLFLAQWLRTPEASTAWTSIPAFGPSLEALEAQLGIMDQSSPDQRFADGVGTDKADARATVLSSLKVLSAALSFRARQTSDMELLTAARLGSTDAKASTVAFIGLARRLYDLGEAQLPYLSGLGITAATQDALLADINRFQSLSLAPRQARQQQRAATTAVRAALAEARRIVSGLLDPLAVVVGATHPDFLERYRTMRRIKDKPTRVRALSVSVRDAATGAPIAGAVGVLEGPRSDRKKTAAGGAFRIQNLPEGSYTLAVSAPGYAPQQRVFSRGATDAVVLELSLEAAA